MPITALIFNSNYDNNDSTLVWNRIAHHRLNVHLSALARIGPLTVPQDATSPHEAGIWDMWRMICDHVSGIHIVIG